MTGLTPYLHFDGTAKQALDFYAEVFGGTVSAFTFGEFSRTDGAADRIAHGELKDGPVSLFAADVGEGEESLSIRGVMFALLGTASPAELTEWFRRLSDGGTVVDDLQKRPWEGTDGQVRDKFGVLWLIGYED